MNCANPKCSHTFDHLKSVSPGEAPDEGSLILCSLCGHINVYHQPIEGPATLRQLLEPEYYKLSEPERNDISFAIRTIQSHWQRKNRKIILPHWFTP